MMEDMKDKTDSKDMGVQDSGETESTPLDGIISRLDEYIKNPKLVTSETLTELKSEIEDLKSVMDGEEPVENESDESMPMEHGKGGQPSIAIVLGNLKKGGGK